MREAGTREGDVRDRVDGSHFSDKAPLCDITSTDIHDLLPTSTDETTLRENFTTLMGRTFAKYMPFFKFYEGVESHTPHKFSHETSQKSEVVSPPTCIQIQSNLHTQDIP